MRLLPLFALLFVFFPAEGSGQSKSREERAVAAFDDGVQHILDGKADRAIRDLSKAVELDTSFIPAQRMLGVARDLAGDLEGAIATYRKVLDRDPFFSRFLYYQLGEAYLRAGRPVLALEYFGRFRGLQGMDPGRFGLMGERERATEADVVERKLERDLLSARMMADSLNYTNATAVFNLGAPINTAQNDYFPFFTNDRLGLLYTRQGPRGDEDIIQGERKQPGGSFSTNRFGSFNTSRPEGMLTLERDGETIFFTLCHEEEEARGCDLYSGVLIGGRIKEIARLPDYLNSTTWDSQAAISCDGRRLFFASTRPGGIGGSDIYVSERRADGSWSEPRNLGTGVNTPEDEEAPFLSDDGETLYFSSMGHAGFGDQDIFFSRYDRQADRWSKAVNIGPPINGANRELGFHLTADGRHGYFASDRPGGRGGLDIYGFTLGRDLTGKPVTYVAGYVTDSLTEEPIVKQQVVVPGEGTFRTNYAGRFFICASPNAELPVAVTHPEYLPYRGDFLVPEWDNTRPYRINVRLQTTHPRPRPNDPTVVPDTASELRATVTFALDRYELTSTARANLDELVNAVAADRIGAIKVSGYTDETGSADYNMGLSERRAAAVADYLVGRGVDRNLIEARGRGELRGRTDRQRFRKVEVILEVR
jgi:outer membrane protein OmpA-like peptidoglycan-associated protein